MASKLIRLDIDGYRHLTVNGNTKMMEWNRAGELVLVTRKEFDEDMWDQWNERKPQMQIAKIANATLAKAWEHWQERRDYIKTYGWDGVDNPWPVGEYVKYEHPKEAYARLVGDQRTSLFDRYCKDEIPDTKPETTKLFVEAARLGADGKPADENRVRFSFGRAGITLEELRWVRSMSYGESGKLPSFDTVILDGDVFAWELAVGNLTAIIDSGQEHWDVEVKALAWSSEKCTVDCRNAENKPCICICGAEFHGAGLGLAPDEVIFGGMVLNSEYTPVTRYYLSKKALTKPILLQETGLELLEDEDPQSLREIDNLGRLQG